MAVQVRTSPASAGAAVLRVHERPRLIHLQPLVRQVAQRLVLELAHVLASVLKQLRYRVDGLVMVFG